VSVHLDARMWISNHAATSTVCGVLAIDDGVDG
jgi:hypothetical protein